MIGLIIFTIILLIVLIIVFKLLKNNGYFGLYTNIQYDKKTVYLWYKGEILESFSFTSNTDIDHIKGQLLIHKEKALKKIEETQQLKKLLKNDKDIN